jgi:hypothetical protein
MLPERPPSLPGMETVPAASTPPGWGRFFAVAVSRLALIRPIAYLSRVRKPAFDPCIPIGTRSSALTFQGTSTPETAEEDANHETLVRDMVSPAIRPGSLLSIPPTTCLSGSPEESILALPHSRHTSKASVARALALAASKRGSALAGPLGLACFS